MDLIFMRCFKEDRFVEMKISKPGGKSEKRLKKKRAIKRRSLIRLFRLVFGDGCLSSRHSRHGNPEGRTRHVVQSDRVRKHD